MGKLGQKCSWLCLVRCSRVGSSVTAMGAELELGSMKAIRSGGSSLRRIVRNQYRLSGYFVTPHEEAVLSADCGYSLPQTTAFYGLCGVTVLSKALNMLPDGCFQSVIQRGCHFQKSEQLPALPASSTKGILYRQVTLVENFFLTLP